MVDSVRCCGTAVNLWWVLLCRVMTLQAIKAFEEAVSTMKIGGE